jgi:hypothetical protein
MTDDAQQMTGLVRYDAMVRAIAICCKVDEALEIRSQAAMLKVYQQQAGNHEAERQAATIRIRAERKVGELTLEMEKRPGTRTDLEPRSTTVQGSTTKQAQLAAEGISRKQAAQWEQLAAIPEDRFKAALAEAERPTTSGIIAATAPPPSKAIHPRAMKIWSLCKALASDGYLAQDPATLVETMSAEMLDDMHTLAPKIATWFGRIGKTAHD